VGEPVADFDDAEGYRAMAAQVGSLVTRFVVRQQFVDGNRVRSIIDGRWICRCRR